MENQEPKIEGKDTHWQQKEVVEMLSLELKSLIDEKPEKAEEIQNLIIETRKRILELTK